MKHKQNQVQKDRKRVSKRFRLRKGDWILIGTLVVLIAAALIYIEVFVKRQGAVVEVKIDGEVKYQLDLDEDTQLTVEGYQGGMNTIVIENQTVRMTDADCPDKICVHTGTISQTGETIVCLPHRVVVEIKGNEDGIDSVVR